jgi:hypothetical protein
VLNGIEIDFSTGQEEPRGGGDDENIIDIDD